MLMRGILCDKQLSSVKPTYEETTGEEILCKTKKVKKEKEFSSRINIPLTPRYMCI